MVLSEPITDSCFREMCTWQRLRYKNFGWKIVLVTGNVPYPHCWRHIYHFTLTRRYRGSRRSTIFFLLCNLKTSFFVSLPSRYLLCCTTSMYHFFAVIILAFISSPLVLARAAINSLTPTMLLSLYFSFGVYQYRSLAFPFLRPKTFLTHYRIQIVIVMIIF